MDYFCEQCASRPKWAFDHSKAFGHACQRCFQYKPCNDYAYLIHPGGAPKSSPAPRPKDLVQSNVSSQSEANLPKVAGHRERVNVAPGANFIPEGNETDQALNAVQPNRPGIKLQTSGKAGPALPKQPTTPPVLELADKEKST